MGQILDEAVKPTLSDEETRRLHSSLKVLENSLLSLAGATDAQRQLDLAEALHVIAKLNQVKL